MVPNGFQHINGLGNFPSDWQVKSADCVTTKITKGTTPPKSEIVQDSNIPFLRVNNLSFNGRLNSSSEMLFVSSDAHEGFLARSIAYPDDILMNIVGPPLGKISMLDKQYDSYNMNQAIVIYRTSPEHIDKYYFLKFLTSELAQQWLQSRSKKTSGQQNLTIQLCKELPVPVPPLPEQRKIAKILSTWDKAISTTERLIDNSKQQKKALMQQLLTGKKRLLDDSGRAFKEEWEEVKLGDACSKVTDGAHHSPQSVEVGYPMFSVKDMRPTGFAENTARHISERDFKALEKQNCKPEINDILIAKDGSILKYCFVVKEEIQGVILSSIALLRPKLNIISPHFIAQYFSQDSVKFFVGKALTSGSGVPRIILKDFKGIHIRIPSLCEQQKIATVLANADQEIELLEQQHADLKQEKKALMQQLLTGKRRVKVEQTDLKAN
ncbi:restriction endonuclease subunit S [Pseudoalteromonas sp. S3260]|uniref:restriction endonuclease subunit S n=1 Tax=Pseudoalteromonas sp. S3260 TaxID=579534 RepID=UPI00110AAB9E|nr:restriction endonuclease subunit S [Pseudoalteromonas sp. S3260]TMO96708.1 restriction endonuclease subunit S [Pseudoalteromonas sp. S3260]